MFVCLDPASTIFYFLFLEVLVDPQDDCVRSSRVYTESRDSSVCTLNRGTPLFLFQIAATLGLGAWLVEVSS